MKLESPESQRVPPTPGVRTEALLLWGAWRECGFPEYRAHGAGETAKVHPRSLRISLKELWGKQWLFSWAGLFRTQSSSLDKFPWVSKDAAGCPNGSQGLILYQREQPHYSLWSAPHRTPGMMSLFRGQCPCSGHSLHPGADPFTDGSKHIIKVLRNL